MDTTQLEALFGAKKPERESADSGGADVGSGQPDTQGSSSHRSSEGNGGRRSSGGRRSGGGTAAVLRVISLPRANNVGIYLARRPGGLRTHELSAAALELDLTKLTPETLEGLIAHLPSEVEARQLRSLALEPPEDLCEAERFLCDLSHVPRLRPMLEALLLRQSLPACLDRAAEALEHVAAAAREMMESSELRRVLAALLAHGNFLNASTARGGAQSIRLDAVEKASSCRAHGGAHSLLSFVCAQLEGCGGALRRQLPSLGAAARLPLVEVLLLVREARRSCDQIGEELALCPVAEIEAEIEAEMEVDLERECGDAEETLGKNGGQIAELGSGRRSASELVSQRFRATMGDSYATAQQEMRKIKQQEEGTKDVLKRLALFFGEDPKSADPDAIFRIVNLVVEAAPAPAAQVVESTDHATEQAADYMTDEDYF